MYGIFKIVDTLFNISEANYNKIVHLDANNTVTSPTVMSPTVMSPTKEIQFIVEPYAIFENEYSLGAYNANAEFESTFNLRKLQ